MDWCTEYLECRVWDCCLRRYKVIDGGVTHCSDTCAFYSGKHDPDVGDKAQ